MNSPQRRPTTVGPFEGGETHGNARYRKSGQIPRGYVVVGLIAASWLVAAVIFSGIYILGSGW